MIHYLLTDYVLSLAYNSENDISWQSSLSPFLELAPGVEYVVVLNGVTYVLVAQAGKEEGREIVFIGNETLVEGEDLPPFLIQYVYDIEAKTYSNYFYHNGEIAEAIFTVSVDLEKVNVILYNKKGKTAEYANVETITTDTVITGAQATFTRGHLVAPIVQSLDMRDGDQIITADGKMFKQVTVVKPDALIPENIKKHVIIGGVEGTFAGDEVEKITDIDFATEYTKVYSSAAMESFKTAENVGKIARVMYEPNTGLASDGRKYLAYYICELSGENYILRELNIEEVPIKNEQIIQAEEDTVLTKVTLPRPATLIPDNIKKNVDVGGVTGNFIGNGQEITVPNLVFNNGKAEFLPETDYLISKLTIQLPPNLEPGNIKEGVNIAGIEGTYSASNAPSLYAPTAISDITNRNSTSTLAYIRVTNPTAKNGYFATTCSLYAAGETEADDVMVAQKTLAAGASYVDFYADDWFPESILKEDTLRATFSANLFSASPKFSVTRKDTTNNNYGIYGISSISEELINATVAIKSLSKKPQKVYWGQWLAYKLTPNEGHYLPKTIEVKAGSIAGNINFLTEGYGSYNNQTGDIVIKYTRLGDTNGLSFMGDAIRIIAEAPSIPWLQDFTSGAVFVENGVLKAFLPDSKAEKIQVKLGEKIIAVAPYQTATVTPSYTIVNRTTDYGFVLNSNGYYESNNKAKPGTAAVCRVVFSSPVAFKLTLQYINYGESSFDFGMVSNVDQEFGTTNAEETSYFFSGKGNQSATAKTLSIEVPAGEERFIDIKYKKDGSVDTGNDSFQFKILITPISTTGAEVNLYTIPELSEAGEYVLTVTAEAEGYTGTDPYTVDYTSTGITVDGETLCVNGLVEDETLTINNVTVEDENLICG